MFRVDLCDEVKEEIRDLFKTDENQTRRLMTVIEDINKSETNIDDLTEHYGFSCDDFEAYQFQNMQRKEQCNIWVIKVLEYTGAQFPLNHRVIYAPDYQRNTIQVLGIMHRSVNYEKDKNFTAEIERRYDSLGLPRLPRA